ncbi:hypothetical protein [Spirosoma linguale]|uniref:PH domain-containing protein n=1 Tax=Spirosoma linguale (strain ATCC 33905 / DSM 74 / LMG 10896 / Claus 1) TaxID=504472 RepID=D2QEY2_SPILD|nr:hypothetical protein Slin_5358 [Spirosoma linguale DSM 74]
MATFFILLVLVFVPFGWFIARALRFTNETVGENSPLYKERSYQFTASQYFLGFFKLLMATVLIEMLALGYMLTKQAINQEPYLFFLAFFFGVVCAGMSALFFYVDWQYWTITRNTLITLNPFELSITVDTPYYTSILTPKNVVQIEHHRKETSNSKDPLGDYGYFLFYTNDGQITRINNIFFADIEFLERFFSTVPHTLVLHRIPWISDHTEAGNPIAPNFAAYPER